MKSDPLRTVYVQGPNGNRIIDYSQCGTYFMEPWEPDLSGPDLRDNSDPEEIGKRLLARHNGQV